MLRLDPKTRRLAAGLSALAGYVDAIGFMSLGGFFVSFMSGNSTRLAVGTADLSRSAPLAFGLILLFVVGVAAGTRAARGAHQPRALVVGSVAALLAVAALIGTAGWRVPAGMVLSLAMGVENAAFVAEGGLPVGLTYMTGTLVKMGQQIGAISSRGEIWQWWPYAVHWLALMAGAVAGAVAFRQIGLLALWPAVIAAALMAIWSRRNRVSRDLPDGQTASRTD